MTTIDADVIRCSTCDCEVILRAGRLAVLRSSCETFYCHNGHSMGYERSPSPLEKENSELKMRAARAETDAKHARDALARVENEARLNANSCRDCRRRFQSPAKLQAHVRHAHGKTLALPEYAKAGT